MKHLTSGEQAQVDAARDDGDGRALSNATPEALLAALKHKGVVYARDERWLLTPAGIAQTSWAQLIRSAAL